MSLHFIPNPDNPNINYMNFTTFTVNSDNLRKKIENLYTYPEVSFPLPVDHLWATEAKFASDITAIKTLLGYGEVADKGLVASRYDTEDPTNPNPSEEVREKVEIVDVEKTEKDASIGYRRLDVTDALFDVMEKKIFQITANLVCTSNEQSAIASDILRFLAIKHHPAKKVVRNANGGGRAFKVNPPKGFAIWVSTGAPSTMANYNFFPLVNHCFLTKMQVHSQQRTLNMSPESFITYVNSRPLQLKFTLTFQEIQAAYRSDDPYGPRNRSSATSQLF
jgi:hypothetical protein